MNEIELAAFTDKIAADNTAWARQYLDSRLSAVEAAIVNAELKRRGSYSRVHALKPAAVTFDSPRFTATATQISIEIPPPSSPSEDQ